MTYLVAEVVSPYDDSVHPYALRFGTYVSADVYGISLPSAAIVPQHLIRRGKVAILDKENKLRFKQVVVSREQDREAVVTEGLDSGDRIITSAIDYPVDGMALRLGTEQTQSSEKSEQTQIAMQE